MGALLFSKDHSCCSQQRGCAEPDVERNTVNYYRARARSARCRYGIALHTVVGCQVAEFQTVLRAQAAGSIFCEVHAKHGAVGGHKIAAKSQGKCRGGLLKSGCAFDGIAGVAGKRRPNGLMLPGGST